MLETFIGTICLIGAVGAWAFISLAPDPVINRDKRYIHPERKVVKK